MAVVGVDIGSMQSVLATISRGTISVVRTELADRTTPSLVLFYGHQRMMGDHAAPLARSNARNLCRNFKNLLGEMNDSPLARREAEFSYCEICPAEQGLAGYKVQYGDVELVMNASRVMAGFLRRLVSIAEKTLGRTVGDLVVACPTWFRQANRQALIDACNIAGLRCLRIINDSSATVLDYGLFRRKDFKPDVGSTVAFVGVGHSATSVCIATFYSSHVEILSQGSDPTLGGRDMDFLIVKHFAKSFKEKFGIDPLENKKAKFKLEEQAEKIKKIISANSETVFHIECLAEDEDCSGPFTRDMFEEICAEKIKGQFEALLLHTINKSGVDITDISSVEIYGGCTRIPWVQRTIAEVFKKDISKTLSGDECVARGSALQAAMASIHYRVSDYGFSERSNYPLNIKWTSVDPPLKLSFGRNAIQFNKKDKYIIIDNTAKDIIFETGTFFGDKNRLTFKHSLPFELSAEDTEHHTVVGGCRVDVPMGNEGEIIVELGYDNSGLFEFRRAFLKKKKEKKIRKLIYPEPKLQKPTEKTENKKEENKDDININEKEKMQNDTQTNKSEGERSTTSTSGITNEAGTTSCIDGNTMNTDENCEEPREIEETIIEDIYEDIYISTNPGIGCLTNTEIKNFIEVELNMENEDRLHREKLEKLNEYETYVYTLRNDLDTYLKDIVTNDEREQINKGLSDAEDWIYTHGGEQHLHKSSIIKKMEETKNIAAPVLKRHQDIVNRKNTADLLKQAIKECSAICADGRYTAASRDDLAKAAREVEEWMATVTNKSTGMPEVTCEEMEAKRINLANLAKAAQDSQISPPADAASAREEGKTKMDADNTPNDVDMESEVSPEPQ